jgi:hypothetical protein
LGETPTVAILLEAGTAAPAPSHRRRDDGRRRASQGRTGSTERNEAAHIKAE